MASRGKHSRPLSPKKVSRRKRTPRCETCGKIEGELRVGGEDGGAKVRLKLCARCRKVCYCGPECQKVSWKRHREVCEHFAKTAPELSTSSQSKMGSAGPRGPRKITTPASASSRQRDNAPTKHPFFGRDDPSGSQASNSVISSVTLQPRASSAPQNRAKVRYVRDAEQGQDSSLQRELETAWVEDGGSTSPPKMERLSMTRRASGNLSRAGRLSNGSVDGNVKRFPTSSGARQKSTVGAALAAALGMAVPMTPAGENRSRAASPNWRRWGSSPVVGRTPWGVHVAQNGAASRGIASPPSVLGRRESAPPYSAALKSKHRASAGRTLESPGSGIMRGPPPPYSLVAHRAGPMRRHASAGALIKRVPSSGAPADACTILPPTASARKVGVRLAERPLPPPSSRSLIETPSAQQPCRSDVAEVSADAVGDGTMGPHGAVICPWKNPTPRQSEEAKAKDLSAFGRGIPVVEDDLAGVAIIQESAASAVGASSPVENLSIGWREAMPGAHEPTAAKGFVKDEVSTPPGSTGIGEGNKAMVDVRLAVHVRKEEEEGMEEREEEEAISDPNAGMPIAHPDKMCREAQGRKARGATRGAAVSDGYENSVDGAGDMSLSSAEDDDVFPTVAHTEPPAPILQTPPNILKRENMSEICGAFDSCPTSAGVPGFAKEKKSVVKEPPQRSFSVDAVPQSNVFPFTAKVKEMAATTLAWTRGRSSRRNSPRPRPPGSPGPAALVDAFSSKSSSASRAKNAESGDGGATAPSSSMSSSGTASPWVRSASFLPPAPLPLNSSGTTPTPRKRAATVGGLCSPSSPPFVPVVEMSPAAKAPTPHRPGPRVTETAAFYQRWSAARGAFRLPPPSKTYLGRPVGFVTHVLVASAPCASDLPATLRGPLEPASGNNQAALLGVRQARLEKAQVSGSMSDNSRRTYYSFADRGQVSRALQPGDVVLLSPGRYEARAWGLQKLVYSVEIIGAGDARACVVYNDSVEFSSPEGENYLVGVMGGGAIGGRGSESGGYRGGSGSPGGAPAVRGKDDVDDDSDSGWEDGAFGSCARGKRSFSHRAVRVRLANLTLEQGSGYRGAIYQLGRDSHLELDGCSVRCSQGGVNMDQGTCLICDTVISGSEVFGLHIGGDGAVEHCSISDCGRGGKREASGEEGGEVKYSNLEDDGTDVNRIAGMPAISVLQSSRARVRFNLIHDNVGHSLQLRDAPLPGGDDNHAVLARRAEVEAEEKLRSWLGIAAVLLREHLQEKHREGSIVAQGNQCRRNRGCEAADCDHLAGLGEPGVLDRSVGEGALGAESVDAAPLPATIEDFASQVCVPTAEEEGLPLPAAATLRFLAAMDEGYIGGMREENLRARKRAARGGAG